MKKLKVQCGLYSLLIILAAFPPVLRAQNLTLGAVNRWVGADTVVLDTSVGQSYNSGAQIWQDSYLHTNGLFNQYYEQEGSFPLVFFETFIQQSTTITSGPTNLLFTGELVSSDVGTGGFSSHGTGSADTVLNAIASVGFTIDQPFSCTLGVVITTDLNGALKADAEHEIYVILDPGNSSDTNDFLVYGYNSSDWPDGFYPTTGTNVATLPAGNYTISVGIHTFVEWNNYGTVLTDFNYSYQENASFSLSLTPAPPPLPPLVQSLTPLAPGIWQLSWTAPQNGNYRILSSPDLVTWTESVSSASYGIGANISYVYSVVDAQGFYRVEYLP